MGGGLLQLVAYGAQDVYLTGNPQITFFKVVYRRHTNFAIECIEQSFNGNPSFNSRVTVQITRNGDLINRIYFYANVRNGNPKGGAAGVENGIALVPYSGHRLLKSVELEIGGQRIDKHYSEWLYIWNELTMPLGKREAYHLMVGGDRHNRALYLAAQDSYEYYIPLEFWFCRNVGLALPLIALQYHEVKINIEFCSATEMFSTSGYDYCNKANELVDDVAGNATITALPRLNSQLGGNANAATNLQLLNVSMWVDYIFLDTDERRRFAQLSHEYLIEQLQFTGTDTITASTDVSTMKAIRLNFNHPCKELFFMVRNTANPVVYWNNFSDRNTDNEYVISNNPVLQAKIQLNGNDRISERFGTYFSLVQPYQHHETVPGIFHPGINVYSFAIKPEEHQPSGTLNMSRIDTAVLSLSSSVSGAVYCYAVNYNVLRILSGMGGLAYSN